MKKKNLLTAAASLALVAVIGVGATLAYFTDKTETKKNVFSAGKVDIELIDESPAHDGWKQGVDNDDPEVEGLKFDPVMPGDTLSKHVAVTVADDSQDAYVAIRVVADANLPYGTETDNLDMKVWLYQTIATATDNVWYMDIEPDFSSAIFYCKDVVSAGETVDLLNSIHIPEAWGNEYASMNFSISVEAAAVQAENVTYEMFRDMHWENLVKLGD